MAANRPSRECQSGRFSLTPENANVPLNQGVGAFEAKPAPNIETRNHFFREETMFSQHTRGKIRSAMEPRGYIALWLATTIGFVAVMAVALMMTTTHGPYDGSEEMLSTEAATGQHSEIITR